MFRKIKIMVFGIPILIIAAVIALYFSLNSVIKHGVETVGPLVLGADVELKKVNISLFSGKGQLKGIRIGNPEGFKTDSSFQLNEVRVVIDVFSLFSGDKIIIEEIFIDAPEITYEKRGGSDNISAILKNINDIAEISGRMASKEKKVKAGGIGKKIRINNFVMKNGKVNMSATALSGQKLSLALSDIHLKDIGKDKDGTSIAEAAKEVFAAINTNIAGTVTGSVKSITKGVGKIALETVGGAVDKLKGLFGK